MFPSQIKAHRARNLTPDEWLKIIRGNIEKNKKNHEDKYQKYEKEDKKSNCT